jgi:hypothetical protein
VLIQDPDDPSIWRSKQPPDEVKTFHGHFVKGEDVVMVQIRPNDPGRPHGPCWVDVNCRYGFSDHVLLNDRADAERTARGFVERVNEAVAAGKRS